jgi:adenine-specific DNA-methyltransferase
MTIQKIDAKSPEAQSANLIDDNVSKLKALFPELVTETTNDEKVETVINVDVLKALVGDVTATDVDEKYGLNWHGKRRARQLALTPSTGTLRPCPDESVDWDITKNLMIEGDNLEVLKLLQKSYAGKVKMIYIDPPYNTGKDFVYPDNFQDNIKNYLEITGQIEGGAKVSSNTEASGRFHTDWLNMMYPRLKLARNLMREDGVIFISIDDAELANLKALCIEIFGEENFVASLIWEKGRKNDAKLVSVGHEYMLVFAKSKGFLKDLNTKWREAKPGAKEILDEYLRLRKSIGNNNADVETGIRKFYESLPAGHPSKKHSRYNKVDDRGIWRDDNMSWPGGNGPTYEVFHPITKRPCAVPEGGWRYGTIEKMNEMIDLGKVVFRKDHSEPPIKKTYLLELDEPEDVEANTDDLDEVEAEDLPIQVAGSYFYRSALQASNDLIELFGKKVFNNPKDREVISRWISYAGVTADDIVMDFFAGSGTTGHSVIDLNAMSSKSIRYVLVQLPESISPKAKGSKPAIGFLEQINKPINVAELTKERLRRAGSKIKAANPTCSGDIGFRVFKLDTSNIRAWQPSGNLTQDLIDNMSHLNDGRSNDDVLYELLLKLGLDLCVPIEQRTITGKTVHSIGVGKLMACLDDDISVNDAEALALGMAAWRTELQTAGDTTAVFRDSAFENDVAKSNLAAILAQHGVAQVRSL